MINDTIAAISSGLTESGIGIVRVSGPDSYAIAERIFRTKSGRPADLSEPNRVRYGYVIDVSRETSDPGIVDEVLLINLKAPHSYTGEDTVELDCHGGVLMMKRILEVLLAAGARLAEPGEFTRRAFLNGRIDLAQAEAVIDVINSRNRFAMEASVRQLKGSVSEKIKSLRQIILHETAFIEAALDDPEHYSLEGYRDTLRERITEAAEELRRLITGYRRGKLMKDGINTVIIGKPNAGKSSLLNAMLGEERAIVTQIPGTTRDTINESITLDGITLNLMDTAGIRRTEDPVESIGVKRAFASAEKADLILCVLDASTPADAADADVLDYIRIQPVRTLFLFNKSDLRTVIHADEILESMPEDRRESLSVSALTHQGIEELTRKIEDMFAMGDIRYNDEVTVTSIRHVERMKAAEASLESVLRAAGEGLPEDFYTVDLMDAYTALGEIIGESVDDDLVNEIFSQFCMGK